MKVLAALLLSGTIFGATYGAAATLGTGTGFLSAGNASVASCEAGAVKGEPSVSYAAGRYLVDGVTVTGLDSACSGKTLSVTLTGSNGTSSLASLTGVVPAGGGELSFTGGPPIDAAAVSGVSVAIQG